MRHLRIFVLPLLAALPALAGTIVEQGGPGGDGTTGNSPAGLNAVSWTITGATYTNVSIEGDFGLVDSSATGSGIAYLMTQIGTGTTALNEVTAPFTLTSPSGKPGDFFDEVFFGLTLGPGTYYLVFNSTSNFAWGLNSSPTQTLGVGVTQNADQMDSGAVAGFAPASIFTAATSNQLLFFVNGDTSATATPEPTSWLLIVFGLGALAARRKR